MEAFTHSMPRPAFDRSFTGRWVLAVLNSVPPRHCMVSEWSAYCDGLMVYAYLLTRRLERAAALLRNRDRSVAEVGVT